MSAFDATIDRSNKPSGKSTQMFYFKTHYEAKHAIGKQHKKRIDFESRPGISNIKSACNKLLLFDHLYVEHYNVFLFRRK